jgi:uncharacterized protein
MQLEHEFVVPVPAATAWPVLLDVERIAPCMPGATVTKVDGRDFEGKVRVKVGPITVTYNGSATFSEIDEDDLRAVITARGKEARGSGTANATITARLHDEGGRTRVSVHTDLAITGRPAQFGRGVMNDVGAKLLDRFAACLSEQLAAGEQRPAPEVAPAEDAAVPPRTPLTAAEAAAAGGGPAASEAAAAPAMPAAAPRPAARPVAVRADEPIDLLETAGGPLLRRLAPALAVLAVLLLLRRRRRRRRRRA